MCNRMNGAGNEMKNNDNDLMKNNDMKHKDTEMIHSEEKLHGAEKLQDAIGLIKDEFVDDAHGSSLETLYNQSDPDGQSDQAGQIIQANQSEEESLGAQTRRDDQESEIVQAKPTVRKNSWISQGAAGLGRGKFGDTEHARENYEKNYNSWVALSQSTERQDKMKKGKGFNSKHLQKITVAAACLIIFLSVGIPWAKNHLNVNLAVAPKDEKESASDSVTESSAASEHINTSEPAEADAAVEEAAGEYSGDTAEYEEATAEGTPPVPSTTEEKSPEYKGEEETEPISLQGESFVLTAAEWRDNDNWPFFTNLVSSGIIEFPSYGIDPRNRVKVNVFDESDNPLAEEEVVLYDESGNPIWTSKSNKYGVAYLFYPEGLAPSYVASNGVEVALEVATTTGEDFQGSVEVSVLDDVNITVSKTAADPVETQVMFIVDTTGSMGDELAYLQMDFKSIAEEVADGSVWFSTNFYRDAEVEYVTKTNGFTQNVGEVQAQLSDEYAAGGGDMPEAVADILAETITYNNEWRDDCSKVAFLIFDAPPHYGTEGIVAEAVESAAARGIHLVPIVASNAERETELFGRALAITTDGTYVFLTDDSGVGESHLEPIVGDYTVELLHDVIVRIINDYK